MTFGGDQRQARRPSAVQGLLESGDLTGEVEDLRQFVLASRLRNDDANHSIGIGRLNRHVVLLNRWIRRAARIGVLDERTLDESRLLAILAEQLGEVDQPNRSTLRMLAAVAWELAGYQANAATLARVSAPLLPENERWTLRELTSAFLQRRFLRLRVTSAWLTSNRPNPARMPNLPEVTHDLLVSGGTSLAGEALSGAAEFMMRGSRERLAQADEDLQIARDAMLEVGASAEANLLDGLLSLLPRLESSSIWVQLGSALPGNRLWVRYLQILGRGIPGSGALDSRSISELWPSQMEALEQGLLNGQPATVVRMPTSAGKTRVAEMTIVHTLAQRRGSRCLYVAPFNALADEVENSFSRVFGALGIGVTTLVGAYDTGDIDHDLSVEDELLVLTPEKLDQLLRQAPELLDTVSLVVLDEGHLVGEVGRGPKYELVMTRLRRRLPDVNFLVLSAVVPDSTLRDFSQWLGSADSSAISSSWRPTVLRLGRLDWDGTIGNLIYPDELSRSQPDDEMLADGGLFADSPHRLQRPATPPSGLRIGQVVETRTLEHRSPETGRIRRPKFPTSDNRAEVCSALTWQIIDDGPLLVFCMMPQSALAVGRALMRRVELAELRGEQIPRSFSIRESRSLVVAQEWLGDDHDVTNGLRRGIGVHYADLPGPVRSAIEYDLRERNISLLAATSTLAQGVNLPVRTVIVHSTRRYDQDLQLQVRMPARDFWNIAGRVGRAGAETEGSVVFLNMKPADASDFDHFRRSRGTNVEPVTSALLERLRQLVQGRISEVDLARKLDPEVLALLVEEQPLAISEAGVRELLQGSLFAVQGTRDPVDRLYRVMSQTATTIASRVVDDSKRALYSSTGLAARSCVTIQEHIDVNANSLRILFESVLRGRVDPESTDDLYPLLDLILTGLSQVDEMEAPSGYAGSHTDLLRGWLLGTPVSDLADETDTDPVRLSSFIEDFFGYKLPWGIAGYTKIALQSLGITNTNDELTALPSMVRFGVPTPVAAWAMGLGIPSRSVASRLALWFGEGDFPFTKPRDFRRWLHRLDPEVLASRLEVSGYALEQTAAVVMKAQKNELLGLYYDGGELFPLIADATTFRRFRGRPDAQTFGTNSAAYLQRDYDSGFSPEALLVGHGGTPIARLPQDYAQILSPLVDIGYSFTVVVDEVLSRDGMGAPERIRLHIEPSA
jgi:helicase